MSETCSECGGPKIIPGSPLYGDPRCINCIRMDDLDGVRSPGGVRPLTHEEIEEITPKGALPVDLSAAQYGLPAGMQIQWGARGWGSWCCASCGKRKAETDGRIFISDRIRPGRKISMKAIDQEIRGSWWSGSGAAWCISCVQRLCGVSPRIHALKAWVRAHFEKGATP